MEKTSKTKVCCRCHKRKLLNQFRHGQPKSPDGRTGACKKCLNKMAKKKYWENPQKERDKKNAQYHADPSVTRRSTLKKLYDITLEDYNALALQQKGLCAICNKPPIRNNQFKGEQLVVDHNHNTGKIRALLCARCNLAIGQFKHNIDLLKKAINYLRR